VEERGREDQGGEADGENSGQKHFIHFFKNLKQEKLPFLLEYFLPE